MLTKEYGNVMGITPHQRMVQAQAEARANVAPKKIPTTTKKPMEGKVNGKSKRSK